MSVSASDVELWCRTLETTTSDADRARAAELITQFKAMESPFELATEVLHRGASPSAQYHALSAIRDASVRARGLPAFQPDLIARLSEFGCAHVTTMPVYLSTHVAHVVAVLAKCVWATELETGAAAGSAAAALQGLVESVAAPSAGPAQRAFASHLLLALLSDFNVTSSASLSLPWHVHVSLHRAFERALLLPVTVAAVQLALAAVPAEGGPAAAAAALAAAGAEAAGALNRLLTVIERALEWEFEEAVSTEALLRRDALQTVSVAGADGSDSAGGSGGDGGSGREAAAAVCPGAAWAPVLFGSGLVPSLLRLHAALLLLAAPALGHVLDPSAAPPQCERRLELAATRAAAELRRVFTQFTCLRGSVLTGDAPGASGSGGGAAGGHSPATLTMYAACGMDPPALQLHSSSSSSSGSGGLLSPTALLRSAQAPAFLAEVCVVISTLVAVTCAAIAPLADAQSESAAAAAAAALPETVPSLVTDTVELLRAATAALPLKVLAAAAPGGGAGVVDALLALTRLLLAAPVAERFGADAGDPWAAEGWDGVLDAWVSLVTQTTHSTAHSGAGAGGVHAAPESAALAALQEAVAAGAQAVLAQRVEARLALAAAEAVRQEGETEDQFAQSSGHHHASLAALAQLARACPDRALPSLTAAVAERVAALERLAAAEAAGAVVQDTAAHAEALVAQEQLWWLLEFLSRVLCDMADGETPLIPAQLIAYSSHFHGQGLAQHGAKDPLLEAVEPVLRLVALENALLTRAFGLARGGDSLTSTKSVLLSPYLGATVVRFLARWAPAYLFPSEALHSAHSPALWAALGEGGSAAGPVLELLADKAQTNLLLWGEARGVTAATCRLVSVLTRSHALRTALVRCPSFGPLTVAYKVACLSAPRVWALIPQVLQQGTAAHGSPVLLALVQQAQAATGGAVPIEQLLGSLVSLDARHLSALAHALCHTADAADNASAASGATAGSGAGGVVVDVLAPLTALFDSYLTDPVLGGAEQRGSAAVTALAAARAAGTAAGLVALERAAAEERALVRGLTAALTVARGAARAWGPRTVHFVFAFTARILAPLAAAVRLLGAAHGALPIAVLRLVLDTAQATLPYLAAAESAVFAAAAAAVVDAVVAVTSPRVAHWAATLAAQTAAAADASTVALPADADSDDYGYAAAAAADHAADADLEAGDLDDDADGIDAGAGDGDDCDGEADGTAANGYADEEAVASALAALAQTCAQLCAPLRLDLGAEDASRLRCALRAHAALGSTLLADSQAARARQAAATGATSSADDAVAALAAARTTLARAARAGLMLLAPLLTPALPTAPRLATRTLALARAAAAADPAGCLAELDCETVRAVVTAHQWAAPSGSIAAASAAVGAAEALLRHHLQQVAALLAMAGGVKPKGDVASAVAATVADYCAQAGAGAAESPAAWLQALPLHAHACSMLAGLLHVALFARGVPRAAEGALADALYVAIAAVSAENALAAGARGTDATPQLQGLIEAASEAAGVWARALPGGAAPAGAMEAVQAALQALVTDGGVDFRAQAPLRQNQLAMRRALRVLVTRVKAVSQTK